MDRREDIHVHRGPPGKRLRTDVAHDYVEAAERAGTRLDPGCQRRVIAYIGNHAKGIALAGQILDGLVHFRWRTRTESDPATLGQQMFDDGTPDTPGTAGNDSTRSRQQEIHELTLRIRAAASCTGSNMLTHMTSPDNVVVREAARAVILDPDRRILLIHFVDERRGASWWATPGGGIRPGETREAAALREVAEETGHTGLPLGPCIWIRRDEFESAGRFVRQTEWYFLLRSTSADVRADGLEPLERSFIREYRWWNLDEIRRSAEEFAPRDLADRLNDLFVHGPPGSPVEVGR